MIKRNYRIHDLLSFQLNHSTSLMERWIDNTEMQFNSFLVDEEDSKPDLVLDIGPFSRSKRPTRILDNNYRVSKDYLYLEDDRKF